ncbi:hypothetical protein [Thermoactinospora rubra]|uniref:hypothetical protein n=1 Tax=Thermoactinospora rubra TaxID=1088767 RepID=UPI000A102E5D|nr:hypothetical protein [Thermoactinospora rubra]
MTSGKRVIAFAAVVVAVVALSVYLTFFQEGDAAEPVASRPSATVTAAGQAPASPLATATGEPFDIYSYLPVTKEQLAAAADLAERFTATYGTFRYDEDPAAYAARVKVFTTGGLGEVLTRSLTSAGTVERNRADQVVSTGTARLKEIREVGATSVVFVITGTQELTTKNGKDTVTADYAVTVTRVGSDWRVYDLQPAGEGQEGDPQG